MSRLINKDRLISMLKYSSVYNTPCPEWVYSVIEHTDEEEEEEQWPADDPIRFLSS